MRHDRQLQLLGDFQGDIQRRDAAVATCCLAHAHFYSDNEIFVLTGYPYALAGV